MYNAFLVLALICQWIYNPSTEDTQFFKPLTVSKRFGIVRLHDYSFRHNCVIVHRGTDSADDVLHDFISQIENKCDQVGLVETFRESLEEYSNDLYFEMKRHLFSGTCSGYIVTGHSLGGANAIISATDAADWVSFIVTFGSPRTCCDKFDKDSIELIRVVNGENGQGDPIPGLPRHGNVHNCGGRFISISSGDFMVASKGRSENEIHGSVFNMPKHSISEYIKALST